LYEVLKLKGNEVTINGTGDKGLETWARKKIYKKSKATRI
jgi:hypothetical protein